MTLAEANVLFKSEGADKVVNSINKVGTALDQNAQKARSFASAVSSTAIGTAIGNYISDLPNKFINLGKEMFNASVEAESMNARMLSMSKNAAEAKKEIELIRNIALVSPVTTKDTYAYALQLKSIGLNLQFALPLLGKLAAAKGADPNRLQAFVAVMTKLSQGVMPDMEQTFTAGLEGLKQKLQKFGVKFDNKGQMVSSAKDAMMALQKIITTGMSKAFELGAKTTETKLASLQDALNNFYIAGGDVIKKFFTPMIEAATKALDLVSQSGALKTVLDTFLGTIFGPISSSAKLFNEKGLTDDGLKKLADALAFISVVPENLKIGFTYLYDVFKYFIDRLKEIFPGKKAPEPPKSLTLQDRFNEMMAGRGFFGQEARNYKSPTFDRLDKEFSVFKGTLLDFFTGTNLSTTLNNIGNVTPGQFPKFGGFVSGDSQKIYQQLKDQQEKGVKSKFPDSTGSPFGLNYLAPLLGDDKQKKEKQQRALDLIQDNTKKANELTLREFTYGGGILAQQGVSPVQMSTGRQVSSPQINATDDISRGFQKMMRGYTTSNNQNLSFRRS